MLLPKQPKLLILITPAEHSAACCEQKNHRARHRTRTSPSIHEDGATPWLQRAEGAGGSNRQATNTGPHNSQAAHTRPAAALSSLKIHVIARNPLVRAQTFPIAHRPGLILLLGHEIFGKNKAFSAERIKLVQQSTCWVMGTRGWFCNTKGKTNRRQYSLTYLFLGHAQTVKIIAYF